ncbi:MAG: LPS assembly lipoprotein LptE, partial [Chitinophagaceae bacterium]
MSVQLVKRFWGVLLLCAFILSGCKIYRFKDVNIEPDVKTVKINFIENKARYKSPQFSPLLTEKLRQKVNNQTRLTQIQGDNADYEISGAIVDYSPTTAGISEQKAATNRLNVAVHIV